AHEAVRTEVPGGGREAGPTGKSARERLAGVALRAGAEVRRVDVGFQGVRARGAAAEALVRGAQGARSGEGGSRHALRHRLDNPRQRVGGRAVPRVEGAGEAPTERRLGDRAL